MFLYRIQREQRAFVVKYPCQRIAFRPFADSPAPTFSLGFEKGAVLPSARRKGVRHAPRKRFSKPNDFETTNREPARVGKMMRTILLIILIILLLGALPTWPYSAGWGYYPSGGLGLILLIVIILVLMRRV